MGGIIIYSPTYNRWVEAWTDCHVLCVPVQLEAVDPSFVQLPVDICDGVVDVSVDICRSFSHPHRCDFGWTTLNRQSISSSGGRYICKKIKILYFLTTKKKIIKKKKIRRVFACFLCDKDFLLNETISFGWMVTYVCRIKLLIHILILKSRLSVYIKERGNYKVALYELALLINR